MAKKKDIKPIYVLAGKDEFRLSTQLKNIVCAILTPEQMQMALLQTDADKITAVEVFDELRTLPFLAEKRVVVLQDADKFVSDNRETLEKYFTAPAATGVLILTVKSWPKNTKLAKALPKTGEFVGVEELKGRALVSFVCDYADSEYQKKISGNAAQMLIELAGNEPGVLCSEIDKLAAFVSQQKTITEKDIAALTGQNRSFSVFEVINAMTKNNVPEALEKLRLMFASDKNAEYTSIGAFAWHFRRMFGAAAMLSDGVPQNQVAGKLRLWNSGEFFTAVRKMPLKKIADCLKQLAEIDCQIKTGQATAQTAIETMLVNLTI